MTPQNIYDEPAFFKGYLEMREAASGLNEVLEQPALLRLLPESLAGTRVLDVGCGFGDFARKARLLGAREVLGIDPSERMLEEARSKTGDPAIEFRRQAAEELEPTVGPFDLVVSSLALHYVDDYVGAMRRIAAVMVPGGRLAFSVEHPMCTALPEQRWCRTRDGEALHWPVDRYRDEGPRSTHWFVDGVVKYHRTVETYVGGLIGAGFRLVALEEPEPTPDALAARPDLDLHRRRPPFLVLAADRSG
jgi:SAM-dependent methyltransferase